MTEYYPNGQKQHEVTYENGFKTGIESFWEENGILRWEWERDLNTHKGIWTQYNHKGKKKLISEWNLRPIPRDLNRPFIGYVAEGTTTHYDIDENITTTYQFSNGILQETKIFTNNYVVKFKKIK